MRSKNAIFLGWGVLTIVLCRIAPAALPAGYYDSAQGKTGPELRQALHLIIRGHTVIPYSSSSFDTSDALKVLDEDPANTNNVLLLYAQRSEPKTNFPVVWNREHLWPNSYGLDDQHPAFSDLHNLRAEDMNVNSSRGNEYYDISDTNHASYAFPAHIEAPLCSSDIDSWEPPAMVKGDIARAIFYSDVRYEGTSGEPDLMVTEGVQHIMTDVPLMGRLSVLLLWHEVDPVDDAERLRNDKVFALYQHNRNPFVDHPEWVQPIFWPRVQIFRVESVADIRVIWSADFTNAWLQTASGISSLFQDRSPGQLEPGNVRAYHASSSGAPRFYRLRLW